MTEDAETVLPTREELLKEYELAHAATDSLETTIWHASAAFGIGFAATLIVALLKAPSELPHWTLLAAVAVSILLLSYVWWRMARRWWSVQQSLYLRMRHIERRLGFHATRYLQYLDELAECHHSTALSTSGLQAQEVEEIKERANKRVSPGIRDHQRSGVQMPLLVLIFLLALFWGIYIVLSALGVIPGAA